MSTHSTYFHREEALQMSTHNIYFWIPLISGAILIYCARLCTCFLSLEDVTVLNELKDK